MNIALEDIKFLERKYGEEPAKGMVWRLSEAGFMVWDIDDIMKQGCEGSEMNGKIEENPFLSGFRCYDRQRKEEK